VLKLFFPVNGMIKLILVSYKMFCVVFSDMGPVEKVSKLNL
jgi:hypothetical protein